MTIERNEYKNVEYSEVRIIIDGGFLRSKVRLYVGEKLLHEDTVWFNQRLKLSYDGDDSEEPGYRANTYHQ